MNQIQGTVAAITSGREVIITVGRNDGVRVGMTFVILSSRAPKAQDRELAVVQAVEVHDRETICVTASPSSVMALANALEALLDPRARSRRSDLGVLLSRLPIVSPTSDYIHVGDRVQQIQAV